MSKKLVGILLALILIAAIVLLGAIIFKNYELNLPEPTPAPTAEPTVCSICGQDIDGVPTDIIFRDAEGTVEYDGVCPDCYYAVAETISVLKQTQE